MVSPSLKLNRLPHHRHATSFPAASNQPNTPEHSKKSTMIEHSTTAQEAKILLFKGAAYVSDSPKVPDWIEIASKGPSALAEIRGSFAVAVRRSDGSVWFAVDKFSIETLCWKIEGNQLELGLAANNPTSSELDAQAVFDYFHFHVIPSPRTAFRETRRLPPGHYAIFKDGDINIDSYWSVNFSPLVKPDFSALAKEFRALLKRSVVRSLGSHRPACFLSGGTDSSTVAGMLAESSDQKPATFSIGFEAEGYDEMHFARIAAQRFGTEHHEYYVTPEDLVQQIPVIAASLEQPFGNSSLLPAYCCAKFAKSHGATQLLAGDGGDELFGGNARYAKQRVFNWYNKIPESLRSSFLEPMLIEKLQTESLLIRKARSYVTQAKTPMPDRLDLYNLLTRIGITQVLTPAFLSMVDQVTPLQLQRQIWNAPKPCSDLDRHLVFDWRFTLADSDLPKVRQACSLAGIAVAYPMLDDELLDFSLKLPTNYKLKGKQLRWFFKEALRGFLPDEIIAKKKQGFGLPFGHWTLQHQPLMRLARNSVDSLGERGILNPTFVKRLFDELLPSHPGYYGEMVWISMMLEQWLQAHLPDYRVSN